MADAPSQFTGSRIIETLILCGCSRCGKRLTGLPCTVDALNGTPTAVHCSACADIVEAERQGREATA
jgi:hypothetical protein